MHFTKNFFNKSERKWSVTHSVMSDSLQPLGLYSPWNSPSLNTGEGSRSLLQGIFPTQGLNPGLSTLQADSLPAEPPGKPFLSFTFIEKVFGAMHFTLVTSFNEAYSFWYLVFSLLWSLRNSKESVCIFVFNQSCLIQCTILVSRWKHIFLEVISAFVSLWSENEEE